MNLGLIGAGVLLLALALQTVRLGHFQVELANERAHYSEQLRQAAQANERRSERVRALEGEVTTARQENEDAQTVRLQALERDRAEAATASDRLAAAERVWRQHAAKLATRCAPAPAERAAAEHGGQAGDAAGDLLADVRRWLDEAAGEIGRYADEGRIRHERCVADYAAVERAQRALRETPSP